MLDNIAKLDLTQLEAILKLHKEQLALMQKSSLNGFAKIKHQIEVREYQQEIGYIENYLQKNTENFPQLFTERCLLRNSPNGEGFAISILENWQTPANQLYLDIVESLFGCSNKENKITVPREKFLHIFGLTEKTSLLPSLDNYPELVKVFPALASDDGSSSQHLIRFPADLLSLELKENPLNDWDWVDLLLYSAPQCYPTALTIKIDFDIESYLSHLNKKLKFFSPEQITNLVQNIDLLYQANSHLQEAFASIAVIKNPLFLQTLLEKRTSSEKSQILRAELTNEENNFSLLLSCSKKHIELMLDALTADERLSFATDIIQHIDRLIPKNKLLTLWQKYPEFFDTLFLEEKAFIELVRTLTNEENDNDLLKFILPKIDEVFLASLIKSTDEDKNTIVHQSNLNFLQFLKDKLDGETLKNKLIQCNNNNEPGLFYLLGNAAALNLVGGLLKKDWPQLLRLEVRDGNNLIHYAACNKTLEYFLDNEDIPRESLANALLKTNKEEATPFYDIYEYGGGSYRFDKVRSIYQKIARILAPEKIIDLLVLPDKTCGRSIIDRLTVDRIITLYNDLCTADNKLALFKSTNILKQFVNAKDFKEFKSMAGFNQEEWNDFLATFLPTLKLDQFHALYEAVNEPAFFTNFIDTCSEDLFQNFLRLIPNEVLLKNKHIEKTQPPKLNLSPFSRYPHLLHAILKRLSRNPHWNFDDTVYRTQSLFSKAALPLIIPFLAGEDKIEKAKNSWPDWYVNFQFQLYLLESFTEDELLTIIDVKKSDRCPGFLQCQAEGLSLWQRFSSENRIRLALRSNMFGTSLLKASLQYEKEMIILTKALPALTLIEALNTLDQKGIIEAENHKLKTFILEELDNNRSLLANDLPNNGVFDRLRKHFAEHEIEFKSTLESTPTLFDGVRDNLPILRTLFDALTDDELLQLTQQEKPAYEYFLKGILAHTDLVNKLKERLTALNAAKQIPKTSTDSNRDARSELKENKYRQSLIMWKTSNESVQEEGQNGDHVPKCRIPLT